MKDFSAFNMGRTPLPHKELPVGHNGRVGPLARRMAAASIALGIWGWTLGYAFIAYEPQYVSKATVIIRDSAINKRYVDTDFKDAVQTTSSAAANPVLNTMNLLKSTQVSDALYHYFAEVHPKELKRRHIHNKLDWELFYGDGSDFLKSKNLPGTDLISLQFTWPDPFMAREALGIVLEAFQHASLNINRAEQHQRSQYLVDQVQRMTGRLAMIRQQKSIYKERTGTVSPEQEGVNIVQARMDLENQLSRVKAQSGSKHRESRQFASVLGMSPDEGLQATALGQNETMAKLRQQYYDASENYALLTAALSAKNPKVREVKAQLDQMEKDLSNEMKRSAGNHGQVPIIIADSTRSAVVNQMATAQAEANGFDAMSVPMAARLGEVNRRLRHLPQIEENLAQIEQEERAVSQALDALQQKALEARFKEAETMSNVFVLDAPRQPQGQEAPTQKHILAIGLLIGSLLGLMTYMLLNQTVFQTLARFLNNRHFNTDWLGRRRHRTGMPASSSHYN